MKYLGDISNSNDLVTKEYVDDADSNKQDTLVSGTNIKTINNQSLLGSGNISISGGTGSQTTWYGMCSTGSSVSAKTVTCTGFTLTKGAIISVLSTYANDVAPTLNVNSTGAKTVYKNNAAVSTTNPLKWEAGEVITFIYDGSYYRYLSSGNRALEAYPIGSIYMSVNNTSPQTLFGGTWSPIMGRFLVAQGSNGATGSEAMNLTAGTTGGEKDHTLTIDEMPSHTHDVTYAQYSRGTGNATASALQYTSSRKTSESTGGDVAHNNLPPYLAVYMWKRTA